VHYLENKVLGIVDARCNHEVYFSHTFRAGCAIIQRMCEMLWNVLIFILDAYRP